MKFLSLLLISLIFASCSDSQNIPSPTKISDGLWQHEDSDATCYQLYTNSISCTPKTPDPSLKKQITKEAIKVSDGIWKYEDQKNICYQLYTNSIDCIPNLKQD